MPAGGCGRRGRLRCGRGGEPAERARRSARAGSAGDSALSTTCQRERLERGGVGVREPLERHAADASPRPAGASGAGSAARRRVATPVGVERPAGLRRLQEVRDGVAEGSLAAPVRCPTRWPCHECRPRGAARSTRAADRLIANRCCARARRPALVGAMVTNAASEPSELEMIQGTRAVLDLLAGQWSVDVRVPPGERHAALQRDLLRGRRDLEEDAHPDAADARGQRPRDAPGLRRRCRCGSSTRLRRSGGASRGCS